MVFTAVNVFDQAALIDFLAVFPGVFADQFQVGLEVGEGRTTNTARYAFEAQFNYFFAETNGFKQLRTPVRRHGGNAHFGHHFQQAFGNGLAEVFL